MLVAAGHPTQIPLWLALRGAAYERPVTVVTEAEPTAFGAAVLAAKALDPKMAANLVAGRERAPSPRSVL